jgi:hypothetical protein
LVFEEERGCTFSGVAKLYEGGTPSMREREVLDGGQLKLCWEERKGFLAEERGEGVRSEGKRPGKRSGRTG